MAAESQHLMGHGDSQKASRSRAFALAIAGVAVLALCGVAAIAQAQSGSVSLLEQASAPKFMKYHGKEMQVVQPTPEQLAAVHKGGKNAPIIEYVPVQMVANGKGHMEMQALRMP